MKISAFELSKSYKKSSALKNVTFSVGTGITGLLGPNGAGKTTLLNILATLVEPSNGRATVGEYDVCKQPRKVRGLLGFLPQDFGVYDSLTAYEFLEYMCVLKGIQERQRCVQQALEYVGLEKDAQRRAGTFSGGMRQRLGIAQALLNMPPVLIIDEPTAGLDPAERNRFRQFLMRLADNHTVLLSTHLVEDIALAANRVIVMNKGRARFNGTVDELVQSAQGKVWSVCLPRHALEDMQQRYAVTHVAPAGDALTIRFLAETRPDFATLETVPPNIEDAYLRLVQISND